MSDGYGTGAGVHVGDGAGDGAVVGIAVLVGVAVGDGAVFGVCVGTGLDVIVGTGDRAISGPVTGVPEHAASGMREASRSAGRRRKVILPKRCVSKGISFAASPLQKARERRSWIRLGTGVNVLTY